MKAEELVRLLLEHPEADVKIRDHYGHGCGHNCAMFREIGVAFEHVSFMGDPNPEQNGKPMFTLTMKDTD